MAIDRDDDALLRALQDGDERTFTDLVGEWSGVMLRLALSHVESRAIAEEVVQEAWLTRALGRLPEESLSREARDVLLAAFRGWARRRHGRVTPRRSAALIAERSHSEEVSMPVLQLDEYKTRQRAVWDTGEYSALSPYIAEVGELVVARARIEPGMEVLDVACGTGNAARPAARAGARVIGLDLTPKLLEEGRAKATAEGLQIEWQEGDAEALPFEDGRFDRVLSTFGHMFAPRHRRTAAEMARVCRRGGAIVTATWTPEGTVGAIFAASAAYMPPPPDYAAPPILWGREDYVRDLFAGVATSFEFEQHVNTIEWESVEAWADFFMARFGPMVTARAALGERFNELRERVLDIWRKANEASDGTLRLPQAYLLSIVRL